MVPQRGRETAIKNRDIRNGIVSEAVELIVDLGNAGLRALDVRGQGAKAILVRLAAFDTCEWHDCIVEDPADVRRRARCGAGQHLGDEAGRLKFISAKFQP